MLQVIAFKGASHAHRQHVLVIVVDKHGKIPAADQEVTSIIIRHEIMSEAVFLRRRFNAEIWRERWDDVCMMCHFLADGSRCAWQFYDKRNANLLFAERRIVA